MLIYAQYMQHKLTVAKGYSHHGPSVFPAVENYPSAN